MAQQLFSIGLDFGTESCRAIVVHIHSGTIAAMGIAGYEHGVIDQTLPGSSRRLPPEYALQDPRDWLNSAASAVRSAINQSGIHASQIVGVGVAFTSCTMLPALRDGTPLCRLEPFTNEPLAWPKLWKHHAAHRQTQRINQLALERKETWLSRYGGGVGLEWFFPKVLETCELAPAVYAATEVWLEAGDWLVWQLVSGIFPGTDVKHLVRSSCQAGYKGLWTKAGGFPSRDFFSALNPEMADVVGQKMPGPVKAPGTSAGGLSSSAADLLGLPAGTPISVATIDAHAGVPGAGVADAGTLVMVLGTSACHMLNSTRDVLVPGVAGVVEDGILPGFFGYETGQASVGDAFAWCARTFNLTHEVLNERAARLPPGSGGVMATDWLNGSRTPHMDGRLSGAFIGVRLSTQPEQFYRALLEATAFGVKTIIDLLKNAGLEVHRFVASGGLPEKSPLMMQIYSDILGEEILLPSTSQSVALGAAILGVAAAGKERTGFASLSETIAAMTRFNSDHVYRPDPVSAITYSVVYDVYRNLTDNNGQLVTEMRRLSEFGQV